MKFKCIGLLFTLLIFAPLSSWSAFSTLSDFDKDQRPTKILVFLSKDCPCSDSHVNHLNKLNTKYKDVSFYGVVTDPESEAAEIAIYFDSNRFDFPIVKDPEHDLVKIYGALKTPHVALLKRGADSSYKVAYEGGVTNGHNFAQANKFFLQDNLQALSTGKPLVHSQGKSLGCYIKRI